MSEVTAGFSPLQMRAVHKVDNASAIPLACPQNFNGFSECYGAIVFNSISTTESGRAIVRYMIRSDIGLFYINVEDHTSDFEKRVLPLQWAVDQVMFSPNRLQQNSLLTETFIPGDHQASQGRGDPYPLGIALHTTNERRISNVVTT